MLAIKNRLNQWLHKIALVILVGFIWLMSIPTNSVEAAGYYSVKNHQVELASPYYTSKERRIARTEHSTPYYATKNRRRITRSSDDYLESGKRNREVNSPEAVTGNRHR